MERVRQGVGLEVHPEWQRLVHPAPRLGVHQGRGGSIYSKKDYLSCRRSGDQGGAGAGVGASTLQALAYQNGGAFVFASGRLFGAIYCSIVHVYHCPWYGWKDGRMDVLIPFSKRVLINYIYSEDWPYIVHFMYSRLAPRVSASLFQILNSKVFLNASLRRS